MTNNLEKRVETHNAGKGAKYTRAHLPVKLVYSENHRTGTRARKREAEMKKWTRKQKGELLKS